VLGHSSALCMHACVRMDDKIQRNRANLWVVIHQGLGNCRASCASDCVSPKTLLGALDAYKRR